MNFIRIFCLTISCMASSSFTFAGCFNYWDDGPVRFMQCKNDSGNSGYYQLENRSDSTRRVCWNVEFNNGKQEIGCRIIASNYRGKGACWLCNNRNGQGVKKMVFTENRKML